MDKRIVVGFSIEIEEKSREYYDKLSDRQKHEEALEDETAVIVDNVESWFNDLNDDLIDTENYWWYIIQIN